MKAFQEKSLVGAFSVITNLRVNLGLKLYHQEGPVLLPRCGARPAGEGGVHRVQRGGAEEARQPPRVLGQLQGHEDDGNLQVRHVSRVG